MCTRKIRDHNPSDQLPAIEATRAKKQQQNPAHPRMMIGQWLNCLSTSYSVGTDSRVGEQTSSIELTHVVRKEYRKLREGVHESCLLTRRNKPTNIHIIACSTINMKVFPESKTYMQTAQVDQSQNAVYLPQRPALNRIQHGMSSWLVPTLAPYISDQPVEVSVQTNVIN